MVHNIHFAQFIPPTAIHYATGTWSNAAGSVGSTIVKRKTANAETSLITIPVEVPSNSVALQGARLDSIEIDYELTIADLTSLTAVINKATRGVEGAVAVVSTPAFTQSPTAADSKVQGKHKLVLTITTPAWIDNDEYYCAQLSAVAPAGTVIDVIAAVANFTLKA